MKSKETTVWECPDCDTDLAVEEECEPWDCVNCGTEMIPMDDSRVLYPQGVVNNDS